MNVSTPIKVAETPMETGRFADQNTPLVRDCWYIAGLSTEITRDVIARRILGVEVALYRTLAGAPVALRNRCPHRSFPLAKGKLNGDILTCGYHGMQFEPSGRCAKMPAMPITPTNANVRSFPIVERGPLVWIWPGDADKADERLIPDTHWLDGGEWASVGGQFGMKSDYITMHENLLDQTHFPFLHPGTVGTPDFVRSTLDVKVEGDTVIIDRTLPNSAPPGIYAMPTGMTGKPVNRFSEARFASPGMHVAFARLTDVEQVEGKTREWRFNITHLITPETNNSIHYWWFSSRNFKQDDKEIDTFMQTASNQAYTEDVDALEWIQHVVMTDEQPQFDLNFAPDKPSLLMRRIVFDKAMAEASYRL